MKIPVLILILFTAVGTGLSMEQHGKEQITKENLLMTLLNYAVEWFLIAWALEWHIL